MHTIKKRDFIFLVLFSLVLFTVSIIIVNSQERSRMNIIVLLTFAVNIVISYFSLIAAVREHPFSICMVFWLFNFFFFCIAPLLQYISGIYAWNLEPTDEEVFKTNILLTIWFVFFLFGKKLASNITIVCGSEKRVDTGMEEMRRYTYSINKTTLSVLLVISMLIVLYYIAENGPKGLLFRSENINSEIESKALSLLINHGFHNILTFTAVIYILEAQKNQHVRPATVFAILCFLIGCFPTGIPRNMMASFYAGMLIILFNSSERKKWITWALLAGLILVFPAINLFRNLSTAQNVNASQYMLSSIQDTYLTGDYDAHQMFISIQRLAKKNGISWGYQLLGVIFFFVPRSIWPTKPLGTGQTAFTVLNQNSFTNVSAPLPSEGYINFGIIGIVIFALIIGYLSKRFDDKYWNTEEPLARIRVLYPFLMLMFFFVCRGDLQAAGSYFIAQYIVGAIVYRITVKIE